jgi:aspartate beta-hydroxylase
MSMAGIIGDMSESEAQALLRQGRLPEAEAAFARLLDRNPGHPEALTVLGLAALGRGQASRATEFLRRAVAAAPGDAAPRHHLARAEEAAGQTQAALAHHEAAVRLRPDFFVARLYWADALDRAGAIDAAVVQSMRAVKDAQSTGRWLNKDSTPPALRSLVERAIARVTAHQSAALARSIEPLIKKYGAESLTRVARALRIYFHQEQAVYPDPRQRPTFLYMPELPASPYLPRTRFPWIEPFEAQTAAIRAELDGLMANSTTAEPVFTSSELERENLRGHGAEPTWTGFYFFRHGVRREANCARCPETTRALVHLPLGYVREHGPEVLFSVFTPGTHLLPHRGVTNVRIVGHLPLIVPEQCALRVGGEVHTWIEGRTVLFDDTYEHEAWNRSSKSRVVLIFDIWHPDLSAVEIAALSDLIGDIGDFRETVDRTA